MTNKPPAFQLYAADFYMDTLEWSCAEIGLYLRLLLLEWINGPLPNSKKGLMTLSKTHHKTFNKAWIRVSKKFQSNGQGLINKRLEEEREKQQTWREKSRLGGLKSGEVRRRVVEPGTSNQKATLQSSSSSSIKDKERDIQLSVVLRDKSYFHLREEKIAAYQITYPNINVRQEILKIIQWNEDNPGKRKTRAGVARHINSWLSGAQGETKSIEAAPKQKTLEQVKKDAGFDDFTPEQLREGKEKLSKMAMEVMEGKDINRIIGDKK